MNRTVVGRSFMFLLIRTVLVFELLIILLSPINLALLDAARIESTVKLELMVKLTLITTFAQSM